MKISLVVLNAGKTAGQIIPVTLAQFVIGRDPGCQLRPNSPLISKRHCALLVRDRKVFVRDFDSTNGTILNDEPLKGEAPLKDGDNLKVGPLEFRVAIEAPRTPLAARTPRPFVSPLPQPVPADDLSHDDIGDLMLDMSDSHPTAHDESVVPDGSTIMDMPLPQGLSETTRIETKPAADQKKKIEVGNAQSAAEALFARLNKRGR